ncbi:PREDICTED: ral GTPase-activating protein subunit beta isoform X11 [Drosophila arizonae]|uniref:Ral GTPase-activating protein subunit beta isoform X11 n=1 Tax=Drosophila arizonae TaxID=7263 RepID=A0ABM1NX47_DROAR|nr:PREDICTED: ral GTPase-activating protein subunit beta isoform X11 [Drosophila arizonae]
MYSEWASLSAQINANSCGAQCFSVLNKFPASAGREVVMSVVKQLGTNLGITQNAEPSHLVKDEEVRWCMDVICFGLSLPLQEHETIKDCVNVYCEWLTALHPQPRISVPKPICEDANLYARQIINHFHNLFVPRQGEILPFLYQTKLGSDTIKRQAVLCHRVLRTLQQTAQISQQMDRETWETLLLFLLAINEILLAPPTVKDDVGDQLCERVLSVLFEVWLLACVRCFPSPSLWKTLQESCAMWRHRIALVDQWNRVNLALTARLLEFSYGPDFTQLKNADEDSQLIPAGMSNDCVAQTWYRFLRMIGNPTALCSPHIISKSSHFVQWALTHEKGAETHQHPCLQALPQIFLNAIRGISSQVDAFLGLSKTALISLTRSSANAAPTTPTSGPPSSSSINSLPSIGAELRPPLSVARPKCNSILHLFGEWLFEAAHIGGDTWLQNRKKQACEASKRPSSMIMENRKGSISLSQPNSLNDPSSLPPTLTIDKYESGRAEAIGTLCKIFCAKKTGEEILPVYLARFYMALQQCLKITESKECDETLASILLHSSDLFRLDLDGINVLLPGFIAALEIVLPDKDLKLKTQAVAFSRTELRRSAINILLSIMVLPLHYHALPIRSLTADSGDKVMTFLQLKSRLMNILMNALQVETDAQNTHMLLGGLLLCVQDAVTFEESELGATDHLGGAGVQHHEENILSSACSDRSASLASGTVSFGAPTAATSSRDTASAHDYPSLTISDDISVEFASELEGVASYDNAHALFVRATYLVCHRLISSWKTDLNVSLAALELLSGLARLHIRETVAARKLTNDSLVKIVDPSQNLTIISTDALECKRAVKWICDYICYQCSRPPPAHSKDLHSTIVAAFQCTAAWLMQHPYLLQDKDCLQTVLEVVELGISGTKSQSKTGDLPKFKDEKELKPASMRVRDAAENLLTIILEQVGYFPSECGPESISSLLDELALMKHCNSLPTGDGSVGVCTAEQAISKFKYFVTENSTILALLEEPLGNDQDPQPTVTLLIRGPFGRHAWTMQLRHLPRSKSGIKYHAVNPGRPIAMNDITQRPECEQKNFPEGVDKVQPCVADYSIPTIDQIREQYGASIINDLEVMLENQSIHEKLAWAESDNNVDSLSHAQECVPPTVCHEFHAARLFLSHFGFLSFEVRNPNNPVESLAPPQRPLIVLDTKSSAFAADLDKLDKLSARTHDTVYCFYVKAGQTSAQEIIGNMSEDQVYDPHFANMLQTLGWPVQVAEHSGWTGFAHNSWSLKGTSGRSNVSSESNYNGAQRVLYWADVSSEIAFVVPNAWNLRYNNEMDGCSLSSNCSDQSTASNVWIRGDDAGSMKSKTRNLSLELDTGNRTKEPVPPTRRKGNVSKPALLVQAPAKIFLVWLESFEDYLNFPVEDLLAYARTGEELHSMQLPRAADCHVIFVHSLQSGLLRVKLLGPPGRMSFATPLVDGMVLSRRVVGNLVRQTALNISRRRRLDNDNYQPPHVRRRLKVQDIVQKYKMDLSEAELLAHLFQRSI